MTDTSPTPPQPEEPPRRLTRSTSDRLIGGVAGGIGRHLNVDPLAIRITFVILTFAGGLGLIAYLLCLAFVPTDDPAAPPLKWGLARTVGAGLLAVAALALLVPDWVWGPQLPLLAVAGAVVYLLLRMVRDDGGSHAGRVAARIAIGIVLFALAVGGFVAAAAGTALGGGVIVAGLVIACGVGLVGGAFRGGARWLIVPALVLALPLGAVAATDLDIRGTWGDRTFHPASVDELADGYDMGIGSLKVDTRDARPAARPDRPAGRDRHGRDRGARARGRLRHDRGRGRRRPRERGRRRPGRRRPRHRRQPRGRAGRHAAARDRRRRDRRRARRRPVRQPGRPGGGPGRWHSDFEVRQSPASRAACMGAA